MPEPDDDALHEAANHRGLKLIKSRKRKPGVGDYGFYGLTDAAGKQLFGFGDKGLSATPAMITDFLRQADASTWAQSARITPDPPVRAEPSHARKEPTEEPLRGGRERSTRPRQTETPPTRVTTKAAPAAKPVPPPKPVPVVLSIRPAKKSDLSAIAALFDRTDREDEPHDYQTQLAQMRSGGGLLVADKGGLIGCAAWHVIPALAGPIGRITVLFVAEPERKRGVGRTLMASAQTAMGEAGCAAFEAMSDIELRNAHGFWRAVGFRQVSYRFVRDAAADR